MKGRQKRSPMLRTLAMLLAVSMLFTSSGFQVMAQEISTEQQADAAAEAARIAAEQQAAAEAEAARIAAEQQAAAEAEAARIAAEQQAAAEAAAKAAAEQQAAEEAAAKAAAEQQAAEEAAAKAAAEQQAAEEAAAKAAAEQQAAEEAAAKAAAEQQAAEEKAAAEAAAKAAAEQAAADAAAAKQAQESVAAQENKNTQNVGTTTPATETTESSSEESEPVDGGKLVLATADVSVQGSDGIAKLKAEYGLGAGSEVEEVVTKLYIKSATAKLTQFDENGKFVEPSSQRTFLLKEDADGRYIEYKLQAGEHFKQEFYFVDETVEAGQAVTFEVVFKTAGDVPEDKDIQETAGKVIYTAPSAAEETEAAQTGETVVENVVTFTVTDGALVTVEGVDATNATAMAKDGAIYFNIHVAEGYELTEVLVDGYIPARTTENAGEYIIEGIKTDETIVSVATKLVETEAPQTEAIEIIETEAAEVETEVETEAETEVETEVETETETEVEYGTVFTYEDDSVVITATATEEAKLPVDAKFVAVRMAEGSAFYNEAVATAESQLGSSDTAAYVCWDVYFEVDGERVEPDAGYVTVTMSFKEAVFEEYDVEDAADVSVVHIDEETGVAEDVTDGVSVSGGDVAELGFTTDSFSPILLVLEDALSETVELDAEEPEFSFRVTGFYNENNDRVVWRVYLNEKGNQLPQGKYNSYYNVTCTFDENLVAPDVYYENGNETQLAYYCIGTTKTNLNGTMGNTGSNGTYTFNFNASNLSEDELSEEIYVEFQTKLASSESGSVKNLLPLTCLTDIAVTLDGDEDVILTKNLSSTVSAVDDPSVISDDLNDFIYNATIVPDDGNGGSSENPTVNNGSCKITLPFKENSAYGGEQFAQILYYDLPDGITVYKTETGVIEGSGELKDTTLGTYVINPPAKEGDPATLTIYFNDFINGQPFDSYNNINCTIEFNSWFDVEISQDEEGKEFTVGDDKITLYFKDGKKWSGNKSASTYVKGTNGNPGYFEFTVEVMSDEPIAAGSNVIFQDIMENNLSLIPNSVVIKGLEASGYSLYENKDSDNQTDINGFTVIINQAIAAHTPIEITYKAIIKDVDLVDSNGNVSSVGNKIWIDKGNTDEVVLPATPTYKPGGMVKKSNDGYNSETGKVKWTVTINPNGDRNMSNVTITDKLQDKNASYDTISSDAPQCNQTMPENFTWDNILSTDRKSWSYTLPADAGYKTYIFTYETIMPSNATDVSYQNNIYVDDELITSDSVNVPGTGTGTGTGTGVEKVSKEEQIVEGAGENGEDVRYVWWESKITIPAAGATGVVYTDELTGAHVLEDEDSFKANLTIKDQNGNDITPVSISRDGDKKFTINFGNVAASTDGLVYTIRYRTQTTANGIIYNTGILYADGKYTSSPASHLVQDYSFAKSGTITDKSNGIITWRVVLNDGNFDLIDKNIIIDDEFSDSLVYIIGSAKLYRNNTLRAKLTVTGTEYVQNGEVIGLKTPIHIEVGEIVGNYNYYVEYQTKLVTPMTIGQVSTYSNTAEIKDDDVVLGEPSASVTVSNKILNKSIAKYATSENNYWVTYEVILNEEYQPFPEGSTTFSIRDVMSENQEVDIDSVVLQRQKQGESTWTDVAASEYVKNTVGNNILTIDVTTTYDNINRVAYKLTYNAHVSQTGTEELETYTNNITYTVAGDEHEDGSQGTADFGQDSSASGTGSLPFIKIKKAELGDVNTLLPGAVFELYRETSEGELVLVKDNLVTDSNGELVFGKSQVNDITLTTDTKYVLKEKTAPAGYLKAEDVEFYLSGGENHPNGWSGDTAHYIYDAKSAKVEVTKTWEIPEGTVTPEVTFTLYSKYADEDDSKYVAVAGATQYVINSGDSAEKTFTWENLPYHEIVGEGEDAELKTINYTVKETFTDSAEGAKYSQQIGETTVDTTDTTEKSVVYAIAVKNATTEHTVTKTWNDNNDALGNRPDSITVKLYRNNSEYDTHTLTVTEGWTYTWTGLPKYDSNGTAYTYKAEEVVPDYYDQESNNGSTIANKPENKVVGYVVTKEWNDSNNQDGKRPELITLKLYYNNTVVDAGFIAAYNAYNGNTAAIQYRYQTGTNTWSEWTTYTAAGAVISGDASSAEWKCEWKNLPKYIEKALVTYDAEEITADLPDGYTADASMAGTDNKIVNSYTPETVSKTVNKYWSDTTNNDDGNRPTKVTVQLKQNYNSNSVVYDTVELNADNNWTKSWTGLPKYVRVDGVSYKATYTVEETEVPQYDTTYYNAATVTGDAVNSSATTGENVSIKNTYNPGRISIEASKSWVDNNDADKMRPTQVTFTLQKKVDGATEWEDVESKTVSDPWTVTWQNLLQYVNKEPVQYRVVEKNVPAGYTDSYSVDSIISTNVTSGSKADIVVTNTHGAKAELQFYAKKEISGNRGEAVGADEFTFVLSGSNVNQTKTTADDGTVTFDMIPYTSIGNYSYTIREVVPADADKVPGITYTGDVYDISVSVVMDTNGQLVATPTITKNGDTVNGFDNVIFTNEYKATGKGSVTISKKLVGKDMTAGEFTFGLFTSKDADATAIKTVTSNAAANNTVATFTIDTPDYTQANIGETKVYYLREIIDTTKAGKIYAYDNTVYTVNVTIADGDNHDGHLKVTATVADTTDNTAAFVNNYLAKGGLTLNATKTIEKKDTIPNEFKFELYKLDNANADVTGNPIQTVTNNGSSISFETISYKTSDIGKTYYYAVKEKAGDNTATYDYSTEIYRVKAFVKDAGDGKIEVETTYYKGTVAESNIITTGMSFTNKYKAKGEIVLDGKKYLNGTTLTKGMFSFTLQKVVNGEATDVETVTNAADGTITFTKLTYTQDNIGKHYYRIVEDNKVNGNTNSAYTFAAPVEVTVTVAETNTNVLSVTADKDGTGEDGIIFNNTYEAEVDVDLEAKKTLTGRELADGQFEFTLTSVADENAGIVVDADNAPQTKTNNGKNTDGSGKVTFDKLHYDQDDVGKTYKYILKETDAKAAGYTYDNKEYVVTVSITDPNNNGVLAAEVKVDGNAYDAAKVPTFANSYEATGKVVIEGTKKITGKDLENGEFTFTLTGEGQNQTKTNNAAGEIVFDEITYNQDQLGEHVYTVKETVETKNGYTFDQSEYQVTVNVTDNEDGTLNAAITQILKVKDEKGETLATPATASLTFNNIYKSEGSAVIEATKVLNGQVLKSDMFTFVLKDEDGKELQSKTNSGSSVTFDEITYDENKLGDHIYYIEEVDEDKDGYTYSTEVYKVTVNVQENANHDGKLVTSVTYENKAGEEVSKAEFINTYEADGEIVISGTKTLTGNRKDALKAEEFSFVLTDEQDNVLETVKNDANGNFVFTKLTYGADAVNNAAGKADFVYYVKEVIPETADKDPYDYSVGINKYKVIVHVADDGKGGLDVTKTVYVTAEGTNYSKVEDAAIAFTNHYNAEGELNLSVQKKVTNPDGTAIPFDKLLQNVFSFRLAGSGVNEVVNSDAKTGAATFATVEYDENDIGAIYFYTISEVRGRNAGYEYSNEIYLVRVDISDNGDGTLKVNVQITDSLGKEKDFDELEFVNKYTAEGEIVLEAHKTLNGRDLEAGKFTFTLTGEGESQTKTNDANGKIVFDKITYDQDDIGKKYSYTVAEQKDNLAGYTYSEEVYTVEVTVTDLGNGKLSVVPTYKNSAETPVNNMEFVNTYAADGKLVLKAQKSLDAALKEMKLTAGEFKFEVKENDTTVATGTNDADGKVTFSEIKYQTTATDKSVLGEHIYKVTEAAGNNGTVLYDDAEYIVKVMVTDATDDGELEVEITDIIKGNVITDEMSFVNDYTKVKISKKILGGDETKELVGAELQIEDLKGNVVVGPWKSEAEAKYLEGVLNAGETYKLVEVTPAAGYVTAEPIAFTVNEDGSIKQVTMYDDTTKVKISKTDITGEKELVGATLQILDSEENVVEEWTSTTEPHMIEAKLVAGATYTLHEVLPPAGYAYAQDVTFTVNEDGSIKQVTMKDDTTKVEVSKVAITDSEELPGAKLQILDSKENVVDEWVSTTEKHVVTGKLVAGAEYILREVEVPDGYNKAEDIKFTVNKDGTVNKVEMVDESTKIQISKVAITGGAELPGATLQVLKTVTLDDDSTAEVVVEEWVSTDKAHLIAAKLNVGEKYILRETIAPAGYTVAKDVTFTVLAGGKVQPVEMVNAITEVTISKVDLTNEKELAGATLQIIDKATGEVATTIFYKDDATTPNEKLEWTSDGNTRTITGLRAGEYILREIEAPDGFTVAKDVEFEITDDLKLNGQKVTMKDAPIEVKISKIDIATDKELPGATLQVLDKDGKVAVTVYGDKLEWVSGEEPRVIKGLAAGTYTLRETIAPDGYCVAKDIEFTLTDELEVENAVVMKDELIEVEISKVDVVVENGEEVKNLLPGAKLQIMKLADSNAVAEDSEDTAYVIATDINGNPLVWESGDEPMKFTGIPAGEYILRETEAPDGYALAADVKFTVSDDLDVVNKVEMIDEPYKVLITKSEFTEDEEVIPLQGAKLEIREMTADGEIGDIVYNVYGEKMRFESADHAIELKGLKDGQYWLVETDAPDGYVIADPMKITISNDEVVDKVPEYILEDCPTELVVSKVDITTADQELPGATLQILKKVTTEDGEEELVIAETIYGEKLEWISGTEPKKIVGLKDGTYILREITAPAGYAVAEDIEFTLTEDMHVENKVVMTDLPTETVISKKTMTGKNELPGAELQVLDKDGNIAVTIYGEKLEWVSGEEERVFKGLEAGTYKLHEVKAPDGYALAEDVEFTVGTEGVVKAGEVAEVVMRDDTTKVYISKMDVTNNAELPGAHLVLKDAEGNVVADWVSTGKPKQIIGELIGGATYTLTEVSAPAGYDLAKDITFTVNTDGKIQTIVMEDKVSDGKGSIAVQKLVMQDGKYIPVDYTFYVALFEDEACTKRISSVKPLFVNASYTTSTIFTNLQYGTYYVAETDEQGNAITSGFMIESNQVIDGAVTLTPSKATAKSTIINHVAGFPDGYYSDGQITVNKTVMINGVKSNVTDTFYFALFTDAALTMMADAGVVSLDLNNESSGSVTFEGIPYGTYYLAETDENGVPVDSQYEYTATIDSSYVELTAEDRTAQRSVVNSKQVASSTTTGTTTATTGTASTVKTGDETPIFAYLFAMLAAATAFAGAVFSKRRRRTTK